MYLTTTGQITPFFVSPSIGTCKFFKMNCRHCFSVLGKYWMWRNHKHSWIICSITIKYPAIFGLKRWIPFLCTFDLLPLISKRAKKNEIHQILRWCILSPVFCIHNALAHLQYLLHHVLIEASSGRLIMRRWIAESELKSTSLKFQGKSDVYKLKLLCVHFFEDSHYSAILLDASLCRLPVTGYSFYWTFFLQEYRY